MALIVILLCVFIISSHVHTHPVKKQNNTKERSQSPEHQIFFSEHGSTMLYRAVYGFASSLYEVNNQATKTFYTAHVQTDSCWWRVHWRAKMWKHKWWFIIKMAPRLPSWEQPAFSHWAAQNFSFPSLSVFMQSKPFLQILYSKSKNDFLSLSVGNCIKSRRCFKAYLFKREHKCWKK